jgi:hypothetical protein
LIILVNRFGGFVDCEMANHAHNHVLGINAAPGKFAGTSNCYLEG